MELAREYSRSLSGPAFSELVQRHLGLVYSVALRFTGNPADAEDVAQAVFMILAHKAGGLRAGTILSGWLYETTRLTALQWLRNRSRRQRLEQEAHMESTLDNQNADEVWRQVEPLLEQAMSRLKARDRTLLALRYFENRSGRETAALLGMGEWAARKRAERALERLRDFFAKRGVNSTTGAIAESISKNAVCAAPAGLAKAISMAAVTKGAAAGGSSLTLMKGALKIMAWTKAKTAIVAGVVALLAAGTTTVVVKKAVSIAAGWNYEKIFEHPDGGSMKLLESAPPTLIIRPTRYPNMHQGIWDSHGKGICDGATLSELIGWAYGGDPTRVILPNDAPTGYFDYLNTLPRGQNGALREKIRKQFGIVAKRETRPTDVLLLTASNPFKLSSFRTKGGVFACYSTGSAGVEMRYFSNASLSLFAEQDVEGYFEKPCILGTDPEVKYDFTYQWPRETGLSEEARKEAVRPVIEDQIARLGLELVATNMPIEMIVAEKSE